jgi:hypothetical protein
MALPAKKGGGLLALMGGASEESDPMAEKERAAGDLISAVKGGDRAAVAHAFQEMYDICAGAGAPEDSDFEDEDLALEEE